MNRLGREIKVGERLKIPGDPRVFIAEGGFGMSPVTSGSKIFVQVEGSDEKLSLSGYEVREA